MASSARIRITRITDADNLGRQIERPMRNLGNALGRRMQRLAPKRSWRLHDSIDSPEVERNGGRVAVSIRFGGKVVSGRYVGYHIMVERGTSKMGAQPYARPALYQTKSGDLKSETLMADRHGTPAERRASAAAQRRLRRLENEAES